MKFNFGRFKVSIAIISSVLLLTLLTTIYDFHVWSPKASVINRVFNKFSYAWTFIPGLVYTKDTPSIAIKWTLSTLYWIILNQWFFGHSIFERIRLAINFDISGHVFLLMLCLFYINDVRPFMNTWMEKSYFTLLALMWTYSVVSTVLLYHTFLENFTASLAALAYFEFKVAYLDNR